MEEKKGRTRGKPVAREIKEEMLGKIRAGASVKEVAEQYGVNPATVYTWLHAGAGGRRNEILEISRLRRENESLLKLLGKTLYDQSVGKKS